MAVYSKLLLSAGGGIVSANQQAEQDKKNATLLIGLGSGIPDIVYLPDDRSQFNIETYREDHHWQVCYEIPETFMRKFYGSLSPVIKGNFMKCADDSAKPHHGCWSKIQMPHPAFHVPQFFGTITLEQE